MAQQIPTPAPSPKADRLTIPSLTVLAACLVSAYGFREAEALWLWKVPAVLVALGALYALRPTRRRAARSAP